MLVFVNSQGRALITASDLVTKTSFTLPELDDTINALVIQTAVIPKPAVQMQGTLGGHNYLNVFGEDPMQIQISGLVLGEDCQNIAGTASALGTSVEFFAKHGVVNRVAALKYTISGQPTKKAFLVALTVSQESAFADMARFNMTLFAESLQDDLLIPQDQTATADPDPDPDPDPDSAGARNTGLIGVTSSTGSTSRVLPVSADLLLGSGDVQSPQVVDLGLSGFVSDNSGVSPE